MGGAGAAAAAASSSSSSSSSARPLVLARNPSGGMVDTASLRRSGKPLTSPWQDGKRPEADDFNDDDDEDFRTAAALRKRRRPNE
jgi:hypothetical protein